MATMSNAKNHPDVVPGTIHLVDVPGQQATSKSRDGIELFPRPSDDPEEPLNWSNGRKRLLAMMIITYTMGIGFTTTLQYSILSDITLDTGISTAALVQGTGVLFLFLGWSNLFWQPIATTYGRRGVYLISSLATVPIMVWTAYTRSEGEWYAHRILLGFFVAPIESLPEVSIPDVFFAHERGTWMGVYVLFCFGSNYVAPIAAGWFAEAFGWRWTMHFGAMVAGLTFLILFFFMEETMYFRETLEGLEDETYEGQQGASSGNSGAGSLVLDPDAKKEVEADAASGPGQLGGTPASVGAVFKARRSFVQRLAPFRSLDGRPSNKQMFKSMIRPLAIIVQFPNVAWAGFIYGVHLCWYNVLNGTASPVLSAAPYNWSTGLVGTIYVGPLVGAIFGCVWSGIVADRFTLFLARRNKGIREPEQRLWPLVLSGIFTCVGLIVWGVGAQHHIHWAGLAIGLGILAFSVVTGGTVALSYNVDCFKDISGESTTAVIIIRNTMGFAVSYGITPWYTNMGLQNCFIMAGILALAVTFTFLLMVWKGKALRKYSAERYWKYAKDSVHH